MSAVSVEERWGDVVIPFRSPGGRMAGDRAAAQPVAVRPAAARRVAARRVAGPGGGAVPARRVAAPTVPARRVPARQARAGRYSGDGGVRLTPRGRIVLAGFLGMLTLAVAAALWLAMTARAQAASSGGDPRGAYANLAQVVVRPGQTLWSIALQAEPTADPRSVIPEIVQVNGLRGDVIQPGQSLWVPKG